MPDFKKRNALELIVCYQTQCQEIFTDDIKSYYSQHCTICQFYIKT